MPAIKLKKKTAEYLAEKEARALELSKAAVTKATAPEAPVPAPAANQDSHPPAKSSQKPKHNVLQAEVLYEKRKRTVPAAELKLQAWLVENFEKKEEVYISTTVMYEYFTESCLLEACNVVDIPHFNRVVREKLGKTFGLTETSIYKGLIKERKKMKPRVKAESLSLKMKDIIEEALKEAGNPKKGVRFGWVKNYIATKYPALRVDLQPKKLLSALERGMRYGHIELVKGIGQCGYYRDPNGECVEEEEPPKTEKKTKKEKDKEVKDDSKTNGTTEDATEEENDKKEKKGKSKKHSRKRKAEPETEPEPEPESAKDGDTGGEEGSDKSPKKKSKKKATHRKRSRKAHRWRGEALRHSEPEKIEDAFPLAITYMSEPKDASVGKIRHYISSYYPNVNVETRLKKALEKGVEKGLWEQVRGTHGSCGTYRLIADEINPNYSESIDDMISQAILAGHEPKQASANLIKKYVIEYHSNFGIDARPHRFKQALERATRKDKIRQLSGIGATGSFQLVESFAPSPGILSGEADEEDNFDSSDDDTAGETYIVRKTKSGRGGIRSRSSPRRVGNSINNVGVMKMLPASINNVGDMKMLSASINGVADMKMLPASINDVGDMKMLLRQHQRCR
ncbi:hypothetical protein ScPMuIL_004856 [Solemya velum]